MEEQANPYHNPAIIDQHVKNITLPILDFPVHRYEAW